MPRSVIGCRSDGGRPLTCLTTHCQIWRLDWAVCHSVVPNHLIIHPPKWANSPDSRDELLVGAVVYEYRLSYSEFTVMHFRYSRDRSAKDQMAGRLARAVGT